MPKFDPSTIGGAIEYDFSKWNGPKGEVPEPSRNAVVKFTTQVTEALKAANVVNSDVETMSPGEIKDTVDKIDDEEVFKRLTVTLLDAMAEVCDGFPSRDELDNLPYRPFLGFFGYLMGTLTNPEASVPDTTNSLRRLRSA